MADSPSPPISQSDHLAKPTIPKLGLVAPPIVEDHGLEELELGQSIERELLQLAIDQAVIEAEGRDGNSVVAVTKEAEADAGVGAEEQVTEEKNVGEGIADEEDQEVMKLGGQYRDHTVQRRLVYPLRPDAEDCAYYMKFGSCKFGQSCKFNHPPRTKNPVKERPKHKEENSERGGQAECKYYMTSGGCRYGKDCKYSHGPDKISSPNNPDFNFLGLPIRPREKECPFYMRHGSCKYGANCRFHHPAPKTVAGGGSPLSYGNGGSLPSHLVSAPVGFTDTPPFIPVMYPPAQGGATPNTEWNGYPAVAYPTSEKGLPIPPAFAMPAELSFPMQHQQQVTIVEEYPERPGQPECNFFLKTGDCKFKSNCKFHHPKNRSSHANVNSFSLNDKGLPLRPDQPICTYYHRYGICKYGPACKYDHSPVVAISSSLDVQPGNSNSGDGMETPAQENEGEPC